MDGVYKLTSLYRISRKNAKGYRDVIECAIEKQRIASKKGNASPSDGFRAPEILIDQLLKLEGVHLDRDGVRNETMAMITAVSALNVNKDKFVVTLLTLSVGF